MDNNINKKELSLPIGLFIIIIWALVLIGIMFKIIKKYTNYDNTYNNIQVNESY